MNPLKINNNENHDGGSASLIFRVRCEKLGHGESVFLVKADDPILHLGGAGGAIPLYTTASTYPWYSVRNPVLATLPDPKASSSSQYYSYRYVIFRAGAFHRFESATDVPIDVPPFHYRRHEDLQGDVSMDGNRKQEQPTLITHQVSFQHLHPGETYLVSDILGRSTPEVEKVSAANVLATAHSLLHASSRSNLNRGQSGVELGKQEGKKKVNFAPTPVPVRSTGKTPTAPSVVNLLSTDGLVVASVFLPVHLHRSDEGEWAAHWDYEALLSMETHLRVTRIGTVKWRGWHGQTGPEGSPQGGVPIEERHKVEKCLQPFNCIPVWIGTKLFGEMYNGFCKGVLWSVFHNVTELYSSTPQGVLHSSPPNPSAPEQQFFADAGDQNAKVLSDVFTQLAEYMMDDVTAGPIHGDGGREQSLWTAYTEVNRQFADAIIQNFNQGDLIWIHGFHLLILPSYLIRRIPMAKIGLFLHTPFPSSEIFRTLWCREDLLRGMLNADQVGFHLFEYARHFLASCRRLLGLTNGMVPDSHGGYNLCVETGGRNVIVTSIHAGVEPPIINQYLHHIVTKEKADSIQSQFKGKTVFCSIDRLESLKGIQLHILGLERFLQRSPEWVGKIVLLQIGISAFERGGDYAKTKAEVTDLVERVNSLWPGTIQFQECSESEMRLQQRMALLRASDICLITSVRDGLNRIPLEFTMAHLDALTEDGKRDKRRRGMCILSEFSSCTRVMRGALHVNPWKISQIANAMHQALTMPDEERLRRIGIASEYITRVTTQRWALAVLLDLKSVQKNVDGQFSGAGLGLGYRIVGMNTGFNSLDISAVAKSFKKKRNRLILLDYGGTILCNDNLDNLFRYQMVNQLRAPSLPTDRLISTLKALCADRQNTVFVVSGKERHSLVKALDKVPYLGLAAEHGMFISWPTSKPGKRIWETMVAEADRSWRPLAISIMEVYTSRTHGSYIEETEMKVLWQYRDADPEFGYLQSRELEDHLSNVLQGYAVEVLHGGMEEGGYVEVRPLGVNKGVLAMHVIKKLPKKMDFGLVLGDDHCDEPMLSVMRQIGRRVMDIQLAKRGEPPLPILPGTVTLVDVSPCDDHVTADLEMFTCTVGKKPSAAANFVNDVEDVHELLDVLIKMNLREHNSHSVPDLSTMNQNVQSSNFTTSDIRITSTIETTIAGVKRSNSLGIMMHSELPSRMSRRPSQKISGSLTEFFGAIDDIKDSEDEDEAPCF